MPVETSPPDATNGRVTMAEIKRDIVHLLELFREERDETRKWREAVDGRLHYLETECQDSKTQIARLDERQKSTTGVLTALIAIASAIAATIGAWFK